MIFTDQYTERRASGVVELVVAKLMEAFQRKEEHIMFGLCLVEWCCEGFHDFGER